VIDDDGRIYNVQQGAPAQGIQVGMLLRSPVNVHSHTFQRAMAGLTERRGPNPNDNFWTWRQLMFRFLDRLTPEHVEAIASFVQMEMLEAGYTTNVEFHYLHHQPGGIPYDNLSEMSERIAAAAAQTGIGLCLLPVHYQFGCRNGGFEVLRNVVSDGSIHMHLAEQIPEVEEVQQHWGARPVEWALDNIGVDERWCLIHCTQMQPHEPLQLAASGVVAGLCPITESSLGYGVFDAVRWTDNNRAFAIGSDSNIRISISEELRTLDYTQRLRDGTRATLATADHSTGRRMFEGILRGGAQAAQRKSGHLEVGYWADMMTLETDSPHMWGRAGDAALDSWVFAGTINLFRMSGQRAVIW
jgi:formimidoylglutamate deiminase